MKLKNGMILDRAGGEYIAVATGEASKIFNGLIRSNSTADFILHALINDTSEDAVVKSLLDSYEVSESIAREDVKKIVAQLREVGLLDE